MQKEFSTPKPLLGSRNAFLKKGPIHISPKIKYGISEPYGDLLHRNLSWVSTFNFFVHEERSEEYEDILTVKEKAYILIQALLLAKSVCIKHMESSTEVQAFVLQNNKLIVKQIARQILLAAFLSIY